MTPAGAWAIEGFAAMTGPVWELLRLQIRTKEKAPLRGQLRGAVQWERVMYRRPAFSEGTSNAGTFPADHFIHAVHVTSCQQIDRKPDHGKNRHEDQGEHPDLIHRNPAVQQIEPQIIDIQDRYLNESRKSFRQVLDLMND